MPTPTPARRATSSICASAPCSANAARAASRTLARLRIASARSGLLTIVGSVVDKRNVALPSIQTDLGFSESGLQWVANA
jgi:hypothetical protein